MSKDRKLLLELLGQVEQQVGQSRLEMIDGQVVVVRRFPAVSKCPDVYKQREDKMAEWRQAMSKRLHTIV